MNVAIIPARGGSKGIPRKNVRLLKDKPLLAYSVEQALLSGVADRVLVSTDDEEISRIAWRCGGEAISRPPGISGDKATSEAALAHALEYVRQTQADEPEFVIFLQATSPLRRQEDIRDAVQTLRNERGDSLFSASPLQGFLWRVERDGPRSFNYDYRHRPMRQESADDVVENGSIYVFKPWVLREFGNRLGGKICVYRMQGHHYFQIDEPGDFRILEALLPEQVKSADRLAALRSVRLLVLDFDGVLTDNHVYVGEDGRESVRVSRADGLGLSVLAETGVEAVVLSSEVNPVVAARCGKLGIPCVQGVADKAGALERIVIARQLDWREVAYAGNDVNDLGCMALAGVPIAVADAVAPVLAKAQLVTSRPGGLGAVREICDWIKACDKGVVRAEAG
jgi:YrbI family 3-deoxy-D-manno-octulosonate 8-phosphate phosphatase